MTISRNLKNATHSPVIEFWCFAFFLASNLSCSSLTTLNTVSASKTQPLVKVKTKKTLNRVVKAVDPFFTYPLALLVLFTCDLPISSSPPPPPFYQNTRTEQEFNLVRFMLAGDTVLCSWARHLTFTVPHSIQEYKWVPANCWGNLTNCGGMTCDGLASRPEILLAASCNRNRG